MDFKRDFELPRIRLCTHRFWKISEGFRVGQVQILAGVIGQDPGEDRVLHQVVVAPSGQRVEGHQVLKRVEKVDSFSDEKIIVFIETLKLSENETSH